MNALTDKTEEGSIAERFIKALDHVDYTGYRLAKEVDDISQQTITHIRKGRNAPSTKIISAFLEKFPAINGHWLLTGQGAMLLEDKEDSGFTLEAGSEDVARVLDHLPVDGIVEYIQKNENTRGFTTSEMYKMFLEIRIQRRLLEEMKEMQTRYETLLEHLKKKNKKQGQH